MQIRKRRAKDVGWKEETRERKRNEEEKWGRGLEVRLGETDRFGIWWLGDFWVMVQVCRKKKESVSRRERKERKKKKEEGGRRGVREPKKKLGYYLERQQCA